MNYHLLRNRGNEGIVFYTDMSSYCCHVGNMLSSQSYTIRRRLLLHKHLSKCKTELYSKCSSNMVIIARARWLVYAG